jgi:hypothetical protein
MLLSVSTFMTLSLLSKGERAALMYYLGLSQIISVGVWQVFMSQILYTCAGRYYVYRDSYAHAVFIMVGSFFSVSFLIFFLIPLIFRPIFDRCYDPKKPKAEQGCLGTFATAFQALNLDNFAENATRAPEEVAAEKAHSK